MVSANRNEYTVYSVYIYTRAFVSKENGVEVMKAPCQYCKIRHSNCHSKCEKYIDFTKELAVKREEQRKAINTFYEFVGVRSNAIERKRGK
jgi:hypothetical protein